MATTIYLIGDGILDNFTWLDDSRKDLRAELIAHNYTVHNFAADNMKVRDIINGVVPDQDKKNKRSYDYQLENGKMYPMKLLTAGININRSFASAFGSALSITNKSKPDNMVVLSMGGNDLNDKTWRLAVSLEYCLGAVLTQDFVNDFDRVIDLTKSSCEKILLVSIYLPYLGPGSSYAKWSNYATPMVKRWNDFIHSVAKRSNIPVLDLNRTLNFMDRTHYGRNETHLSNRSNKMLADAIHHIYKHYKGYRAYYAPGCDITKLCHD
jgi:lysophospholipase L1-like esterase